MVSEELGMRSEELLAADNIPARLKILLNDIAIIDIDGLSGIIKHLHQGIDLIEKNKKALKNIHKYLENTAELTTEKALILKAQAEVSKTITIPLLNQIESLEADLAKANSETKQWEDAYKGIASENKALQSQLTEAQYKITLFQKSKQAREKYIAELQECINSINGYQAMNGGDL